MTNDAKEEHVMISGWVSWWGLAVWILICFVVASMGAIFRPGEWYDALVKPSWNPPNWIFGPVWTTLYFLMAIAVWRVWIRGGVARQGKALKVFLVQLLLNGLWTPLFFGFHRMGIAFVEILLLVIAIFITIRSFWAVDRVAAFLLFPYFGWVSFASLLNLALWRMN